MPETREAPERIYLQIPDDCDGYGDAAKGEMTWCKDQINEGDIEYLLASTARLLPSRD